MYEFIESASYRSTNAGKMARSEVLHEARVTQCELASAAGSFGT